MTCRPTEIKVNCARSIDRKDTTCRLLYTHDLCTDVLTASISFSQASPTVQRCAAELSPASTSAHTFMSTPTVNQRPGVTCTGSPLGFVSACLSYPVTSSLVTIAPEFTVILIHPLLASLPTAGDNSATAFHVQSKRANNYIHIIGYTRQRVPESPA